MRWPGELLHRDRRTRPVRVPRDEGMLPKSAIARHVGAFPDGCQPP